MMAALPHQEKPKSGAPPQAARNVLPVVLMDFETVTAAYEQHWRPGVTEAACREGFPPATLADLQRLLKYQGIRQDQVGCARSMVP